MLAKFRSVRQIILVLSLLSFVGTIGVSLFGYASRVQSLQESPQVEATSPEAELKAQEKGYETVLAREPNNTLALEGLAQTRLMLDDPEGAIAPLETLVQLHPEDEAYKVVLTSVREKVALQPLEP
ncbi:tetratricopeptide repeat protein [Synechococcales cyanobacterium C]|uniref:Tetratricopeptide repeat protein n=1 Tax=Petrachloros mirabilis ULC683 TaxID=2781853 RepID=A0A8K1ZVE0_9CYAN|nr:tetratricopeptide repeat protein [Petrachloros mirabilis]NCJ05895.1 tetratricopeptide repeat protein [Petrachloros mirabilis ULC683]